MVLVSNGDVVHAVLASGTLSGSDLKGWGGCEDILSMDCESFPDFEVQTTESKYSVTVHGRPVVPTHIPANLPQLWLGFKRALAE